VFIAQLGPSFFIGLFWNRGSAKAAKIGMVLGVIVVSYTLILPFTINLIAGDTTFVDNGPFGIELLKPYELLRVKFLSIEAHAFFWSMFVNIFSFLIISLLEKGNYRERNYAEVFVNSNNYVNLQDGAYVWKGEAYVSDIKDLLIRFLGVEKTERALDIFNLKYNISKNSKKADSKLINFSEKLLTGSIGGASAKILIASIVKEQPVS